MKGKMARGATVLNAGAAACHPNPPVSCSPADSIRARLKEARQAADLTLKQVASSIGFAESTLSGVENGHDVPSQRLLESWIKELKVNREWVMSGTGEMDRRGGVFIVIPKVQIQKNKDQALRWRETAAWMIDQAKELEASVEFSEAYHAEAEAKEKPIQEKMAKGLTRQQAIEVIARQKEYDSSESGKNRKREK
jgi:transcriptional regulator with XRE-family HTH domain